MAPGLAVVAIGVAIALAVAAVAPAVSALTVAVVLGIAVGNLGFLPERCGPGLAWAAKRLVRAGVVLLGLQLAVTDVLDLGGGMLVVVLATVSGTFLGTRLLGRWLGLPAGLSTLVATGFSICGAAAVAAMEGVVPRRDRDVATAVALVTLFGSVWMLALPLVAELLGLSARATGGWAGASVHEVAQVLVGAAPAGAAAVSVAVVVKLSRVVLLAPLVAIVGRRQGRWLPPVFVLGFVAMILVRSSGILPVPVLDVAKLAATVLMAGALFALGSTVRLKELLATGPRALVLGAGSTALVAGISLAGLALVGW
ncbi:MULTISPECIES: YeiH family protein [unclassified Crossiella]|uniref:YeiH family protein n=1 Tax=unclassified Crossiella TaxID=2620835 RepID=UPI001FFF41B6|nr:MULTISPECIES: putative sulfate exporter family transporter [unclassified Crossiella]MCK2242263.1 putative sulfate exporter family transporter [Crossiella sp. S99.2]MCK2254706.1 putative sulfate exporter family transporter [Crossiella sp. S99.1]